MPNGGKGILKSTTKSLFIISINLLNNELICADGLYLFEKYTCIYYFTDFEACKRHTNL